MQEFNLKQRSNALALREMDIQLAEGNILSLEVERDTLARRLELIENREATMQQTRYRARTYGDSPSLG
ncbi:hypothetical protein IAE36_000273 [Pseudomonas sp. S36]|nr:hypothetical protein [Pseudomonas sp. S36]